MYEDEEILEEEQEASGDKCPRCLVPIPQKAVRCPHCGFPIARKGRFLPVLAGVAGVLALVFLCVVMYRAVHLAELEEGPSADSAPAAAAPFAPPPETSAGHEEAAKMAADDFSKPTAPEPQKKPPLNR